MKILFLFISAFVFSQSKNNCIKESITQNDYYMNDNYLVKGFSHGDIDFEIEVDYEKSNNDSIVLIIFEKNNGNNKIPLTSVSCNKICPFNDKLGKFKIKKNISLSDENGRMTLNLNLKGIKFLSINYPGFKPIIIYYEKIVNCFR